MKTIPLLSALLLAVLALTAYRFFSIPNTEGYVLEHDAQVARMGPSPHQGKGNSVGYSFFEKAPNYPFAFRKRVLQAGSSIGYHLQETDEVYYIIGGTGLMTINGKAFAVKPGDAILTRPGSSHGLVQTGREDLALIITYQEKK